MRQRKRLAVILAASALAAGGILVAEPAQAAVYADCAVGITGKNNDMVTIYCNQVIGGYARGRADCKLAPDVYTNWVGSYETSTGGPCWFSARKAIMETTTY